MDKFSQFIDRISQPLLVMLSFLLVWAVIVLQHSPLTKCLTLASALFCIGLYGVLSSKSVIKTLISLEMLFNAANINLIAFAKYTDLTFVRGQVFSLFVMAVAAAEVALGLALVIAIYRLRQTSSLKKLNELNG